MTDIDARLDEILNYVLMRFHMIEDHTSDPCVRTYERTVTQFKQLISEEQLKARLVELDLLEQALNREYPVDKPRWGKLYGSINWPGYRT
jgi:hypothetical protein